MNLHFKKAEKKDIPAIFELAKTIWNTHYVPIIGQEQVNYMLDKFYSESALTEQMKNGHEFTIVSDGTKNLGYASVSKTEKKYFLHKIYVLVDEHAKGIGTELLNYLLEKYKDGETIELTVNRQNYKAINFYFKHGFTIQSVEDFDIGNGYFMNDFVMIKKLKS